MGTTLGPTGVKHTSGKTTLMPPLCLCTMPRPFANVVCAMAMNDSTLQGLRDQSERCETIEYMPSGSAFSGPVFARLAITCMIEHSRAAAPERVAFARGDRCVSGPAWRRHALCHS